MSRRLEIAAELEKLHRAATAGPWEYDGMHNEICAPQGEAYWLIVSETRSAPDQEHVQDKFGHQFDANFDLISKVRNMLPEIIKELRTARTDEEGEEMERKYEVTCPECGRKSITRWSYELPLGGIVPVECECGHWILPESEGNPVEILDKARQEREDDKC